jgi:hypothetical protein
MGGLFQAVYALRKAAETEFTGNAYYLLANRIGAVMEAIGWDHGAPVGRDAAYGFASALQETRKQTVACLTGNRYYLAANAVDALASFLTPAAKQPAAEVKSGKSAGAAAFVAVNPALQEAVQALRSGAEAEFKGNDYYLAANRITGLIESIGWDKGFAGAKMGAGPGFAAALQEVRKQAGASLSGGHLAQVMLAADGLAACVAPAAVKSEKPAAAPAPKATAPAQPEMAAGLGNLFQALRALHSAAEAELKGNAYYLAANRITGVIESTGWDKAVPPGGAGAGLGFAAAVHEARKQAVACLTGNRYYLTAHGLDALAVFLAPAPAAKQQAAEAKSEKPATVTQPVTVSAMPEAASPQPYSPATVIQPAGPKQTFEDLAAVAKRRAGGVAANFGIVTRAEPRPERVEATRPQPAVIARPEPAEIAAAAEFERRSSEPCAMAELAPVVLETAAAPAAAAREETPAEWRLESRSSGLEAKILEAVEPASIPAEAAAEPRPSEAAFYLGSPAAESDAELEEEAVRLDIAAAQAPAAVVAAPAPAQSAAPAAPQKEAKKPAEAKPKAKKTLFRMWANLFFGRKG